MLPTDKLLARPSITKQVEKFIDINNKAEEVGSKEHHNNIIAGKHDLYTRGYVDLIVSSGQILLDLAIYLEEELSSAELIEQNLYDENKQLKEDYLNISGQLKHARNLIKVKERMINSKNEQMEVLRNKKNTRSAILSDCLNSKINDNISLEVKIQQLEEELKKEKIFHTQEIESMNFERVHLERQMSELRSEFSKVYSENKLLMDTIDGLRADNSKMSDNVITLKEQLNSVYGSKTPVPNKFKIGELVIFKDNDNKFINGIIRSFIYNPSDLKVSIFIDSKTEILIDVSCVYKILSTPTKIGDIITCREVAYTIIGITSEIYYLKPLFGPYVSEIGVIKNNAYNSFHIQKIGEAVEDE